MKTLTRRAALPLVLVAALVATGCLGGTAPTRFYVLAPVDGPVVADARAMTLGVGPVTLASYLDRPQIVTRPATDKIDLGEFDQWTRAACHRPSLCAGAPLSGRLDVSGAVSSSYVERAAANQGARPSPSKPHD